MKTVFSEKLKAAREVRNMTQAELSTITSIETTQIAHFESGNRNPSIDNLKKLCVGLNVSADYLLGISEEPFITQQTIVNNLLSALSNRDFDLIMNLLQFMNKKGVI